MACQRNGTSIFLSRYRNKFDVSFGCHNSGKEFWTRQEQRNCAGNTYSILRPQWHVSQPDWEQNAVRASTERCSRRCRRVSIFPLSCRSSAHGWADRRFHSAHRQRRGID